MTNRGVKYEPAQVGSQGWAIPSGRAFAAARSSRAVSPVPASIPIAKENEMKTAGIVLDSWKLAIFKRHLKGAGFEFTTHPGITADTLTLKVKTELIAPLQRVIEAAQKECASQ